MCGGEVGDGVCGINPARGKEEQEEAAADTAFAEPVTQLSLLNSSLQSNRLWTALLALPQTHHVEHRPHPLSPKAASPSSVAI